MRTQPLGDEGRQIMLRQNIGLHYFGNGCLVEYNSGNIAFLNQTETKLVEKLNGAPATIKSLLQNTKSTKSQEELTNMVEGLIRKGIFVYNRSFQDIVEKTIISGEFGKYYPQSLMIELTNVCNYRCSFCYRNACGAGLYISDELIERIYKFSNGKVGSFLLTGGEPTLHPKIEDYISKLSSIGLVSLITNGSRFYELNDNSLEKLAHVQFSLYGCSESEYLKKTGNPHGFTDISKSVRTAKQLGVGNNIAVTLPKEDLNRIEEYIEAAINMGTDYILIEAPELFGRGDGAYNTYDEYDRYVEELHACLIEKKRKYIHKIKIALNNIEAKWDGTKEEKGKQFFPTHLFCGSGTERFIISPRGNVRACEVFDENIFNLGDLGILNEHVNGDFHEYKLMQSINYVMKTSGKPYKDALPCTALQDFYITHMRGKA